MSVGERFKGEVIYGDLAQLVEHSSEQRSVPCSIQGVTTKKVKKVLTNVKQKSYIRYEQIVKHIKLTLQHAHWI